MTNSSKNKRLKNPLITRATFTMLTLLTIANPETKAQFVPPVGTAGNDTITGSGVFVGSLDATQGGVDTITVAGGSTITFGGATPNTAIIDAGLGTITVNAGSNLNAPLFGQKGIYTTSNVTSAGNTLSTTVTNAGSILVSSYAIYSRVQNNIATGSALVSVTNSGSLSSTSNYGIRAEAESLATSTVSITNSGAISSVFPSIYTDATSNTTPTGTAIVNISNSGNLTSSSNRGIISLALGVASATNSVQNSGQITSNLESLQLITAATALTGGDATSIVTNSGNLTSTSQDGIDISTQGVTSATTTLNNSGDITSNLRSIIISSTANTGPGGSASANIFNSGGLTSTSNRGIQAAAFGVTSATLNIQNAGDIISANDSIFAQSDATFGTGGSASLLLANSAALSSTNNSGIDALSSGITGATATVQNSGDITAADEAVRVVSNTNTVGATGDSLTSFSNSGNLFSNNDDAVELFAVSRNNATINFSNSGTVQTNANGVFHGIDAFADATFGTGGVATIIGSNSGQVSAGNLAIDAIRLLAQGELGANISFSNTGVLTALSLIGWGLNATADTSSSGTNANASVILSNSGTINAPNNSGIQGNSIATGDATVSISNSGVITAGGDGIYAFALGDSDGDSVGTGSIKVINSGTINTNPGTFGINIDGLNSPEAEVYNLYGSITSGSHAIRITNNVGVNRTWLVGGNINAGGMVFQGNGNSTLHVINNPQLNGGMMDGGGGTSQIKFQLVGMSPKEAKKAKAQMGNSAGSFSINGGKLEYNWQNFNGGSSGKFISLQTKVDKSLVPAAKWLDNNAYKNQGNIEIAKFYLAAGSNPGKEIANLMGQAEALARNDVLLEYSNLIAYMSFNMGHDFAAGYAARSFDISMVNLYRPDVLIAGNMMMNRLNRMSDSPMRNPRKAPVNEISPWSVWLGGNALMATQDKWEDRAGYDNLTGNPMVGLNYRPSANTNIGLMAGATITELDFTNRSKLEGLGGLFALHGTQRFADFYTSAFVGGGLTGFEQQRRIRGRTARADFDSSMITGGGNLGYGFKVGNLTLAPEAGLVYTHLMHDGYRERGAGVFNRRVGSSDVDSLKTRLGGRLSYLVEMTEWVLAPYLHASWAHELMYDNNEAPVKLPRFGMPSFDIGNDNPERDSALIGVGVSGKVNKLSQLSWYLGYEANIGFTHYMSHTGSLGFRWDF